jgi:hypothetical protein
VLKSQYGKVSKLLFMGGRSVPPDPLCYMLVFIGLVLLCIVLNVVMLSDKTTDDEAFWLSDWLKISGGHILVVGMLLIIIFAGFEALAHWAVRDLPVQTGPEQEPMKGPRQMMIEAIVGWWPSKGHPPDAKAISTAVGLAALAVFGMPVLITGYITLTGHFFYRRISSMFLSRYIEGRDYHMLNGVYSRVLEVMDMKTLDDDQKRIRRHQIREAIFTGADSAIKQWSSLQSRRLNSELERIRVGEPSD